MTNRVVLNGKTVNVTQLSMPRLLRYGDIVAILATSGPCDPIRLSAGVDAVKSMGLVPWVMESCHLRHGYLAGADDMRLRDLHAAFAAPYVRGIFVARGGYGAGRLLPGLDFELLGRNPKVFVGYSDVTALHIAITQACGFITFHGPMVAADFGRGQDTMDALQDMIFESLPRGAKQWRIPALGQPLTTIVPGRATGPLTGGNLSLLAASLGTPYEINTKGSILFIEEIDEPPYRIDRMLLQLKQAGKLADAAGIILGDFTPQTPKTLQICINELIIPEGKPTLAGLSCGHTLPNITLPIGLTVSMCAT